MAGAPLSAVRSGIGVALPGTVCAIAGASGVGSTASGVTETAVSTMAGVSATGASTATVFATGAVVSVQAWKGAAASALLSPVRFTGTKLHTGVILMVLCLVFFGVFLWKTSPGLEMQIVGQNNRAAAYAGINVQKNTLLAMFMAGGFAGLAGAIEVLGVQHRLLKGMASNFGFDGVAVALLGASNPVGMFFAGILLGAMKSGGNAIQMFTPVPSSVVDLIRALVIVFVLVNVLYRVTEKVKQHKKEKKGVSANV